MTPKEGFLQWFAECPLKARKELVFDAFGKCYSLNVCAIEVKNNTEVGTMILKNLGFS